ncbi:hypothetical protein WMF04_26955 [Sorangium sp. So ce260]|uniref:hypothetical protein n=1 Tax=Sorangium sp. So ce260 TaxID=3133291 RepID=UPI003F612BCC
MSRQGAKDAKIVFYFLAPWCFEILLSSGGSSTGEGGGGGCRLPDEPAVFEIGTGETCFESIATSSPSRRSPRSQLQ